MKDSLNNLAVDSLAFLDSMQDILDVEDPLSPSLNLPWWVWLFILLIPIIYYSFLRFFSKGSLLKHQKAEAIRIAPVQKAKTAMLELKEDQLHKSDSKEFLFRLTDILKEYIEGQYPAIDARGATSRELDERLKEAQPFEQYNADYIQKIHLLGKASDPVKFADATMEAAECLQWWEECWAIIHYSNELIQTKENNKQEND
jgi:hypothetical protein